MSRMLPWLGAALCAAGMVFGGVERCWGGEPERSTSEQKIEEALDAMVPVMEFVDQPLTDVIDYLKDSTKIEIQLDAKALEEQGISAQDVLISTNLRGVSLESALRLLLRGKGLAFTVDHQVLLITTPESASDRQLKRFYPVVDQIALHGKANASLSNADALGQLIVKTIEPTTWDENGGAGSLSVVSFNGAEILVVSQSHDVHRQIAKLLADLRKIASSQDAPAGK